MKDWAISKRLILGLGAIMVLIAIFGAFAMRQLMTVAGDMTRLATDTLLETTLSGQLDSLARDQRAWLLQHQAAQSPAEMQRLEEAAARTADLTAKVLHEFDTTIAQAAERSAYERLAPLRERFLRSRDEIFTLDRAGRHPEALAAISTTFEPAFNEYRDGIDAVQRWNATDGKELATRGSEQARLGTIELLVGIGAIGVLTVLVGFLLVRAVGGSLSRASVELRDHSEQIASAAAQVATSAQSLSRGATEQAASLEETSASMEEMASMTRKNAENATQAALLVTDVAQQMGDSNAALGGMVSSMVAIKESSAKVAKIIKTIDEIAFQTNILALNAAVEAARAGEAGMGFAVVADEVRSLAQRSARAAQDTAVLIEESIARSQEGSGRVEQVAAAIGMITANVTKVKGIVEEVRESSRQQTQGIEQVTQSVAQMEKVTQTTAATAEESAAASEELNAQAEASMVVVKRLEHLVGGQVTLTLSRLHLSREVRGVRPPAAPVVMRQAPPKAPRTPPSKAELEFPLTETGTHGRF